MLGSLAVCPLVCPAAGVGGRDMGSGFHRWLCHSWSLRCLLSRPCGVFDRRCFHRPFVVQCVVMAGWLDDL
jgi:hypothetical protein